MNLETSIAGIKSKNPFMNGAGIYCQTSYQLMQWIEAGVGIVVADATTLDEKKPNPFDYNNKKIILIRGKEYTINSRGLHNKGLKFRKNDLNKIKFEATSEFKVPIGVNVATATGDLNEYKMTVQGLEEIVDFFEINVSCPNTGREIIGYNLKSLEQVLSSINTKKPISVKLPCYYKKDSLKKKKLKADLFTKKWLKKRKYKIYIPKKIDINNLNKVLDLLDDYNMRCVTSHNTIPVKHPLLSTSQGGLSGRPIHNISVKQAKAISEYSSIDIIASGGVINPKDAIDFLKIKNVKAVQLASGLFKYEVPEFFFNDIYNGVRNFMQKRNIKNLKELKIKSL